MNTTARSAIRRHRATLRRIGRAGYVAHAAIHLLIAWLAAQIAFGRSARAADAGGAIGELASAPLGRLLLALLMVGFSLLVLWKVVQVAIGVEGTTGRKDLLLRVVAGGQAIVFAVLAVSTGRLALRAGAQSNGHAEQQGTSWLLGVPGGQTMVGLAGLIVAGIGVGMVGYGLARRFTAGMNTDRLSTYARRTVLAVGVLGYAAKGIAYAIVGGLVLAAAVSFDPHRSGGLDMALHTLAAQPYGRLLLLAIATGIGCFGLLCLVRARYQRR